MRPADPSSLATLHEKLLFQRAYPRSEEEARRADDELAQCPALVAELRESGHDLSPLEEYHHSGIAGAGMTAVFSYGVARHLVKSHPGALRIAWEAWETADALGRVLPSLTPAAAEDALVEAHIPWAEWLEACARGGDSLAWLIKAIGRRWRDGQEAADRYDALQMPLRWEFGSSSATRTLMRLPVKSLFCHDGPLITRRDVSLDRIPELPPLTVRPLGVGAGEMVLALARDTSAVRYRELHGFTWGDPRSVVEIRPGRGVELFLNTVPHSHQLPLRRYHSMSIWKNGVPVGYFEGLSIAERMDAGFNLYFTFRAGETAWLYAQILHACRQLIGVTCFVIDPYQIGHENDEAIESGAFWFYRKLGFRSVSAELRAVTEQEERRLARKPGGRSTPATLRRLVAEPMIYQFPGTESAEWDGFRLRRALFQLAADGKMPKRLSRAAILELGC